MLDHVARDPGRVLITPENGGEAFYATLSLADNPTVDGTKLNKASLLKDTTASLFELGADATPDDVLVKIRSLITTVQNSADSANTNANGRAKVVTGSYTGNGAMTKTLNFSIRAKIVVISASIAIFGSTGSSIDSDIVVLVYGVTGASVSGQFNNQYGHGFSVTWSTTSLTLKLNNSSITQHAEEVLNKSGVTYYYAAVG